MARPGGVPRHFWAAVRTTSMPQASMRSSMPPVAQTPSTMKIEPVFSRTWLYSSTGAQAPVAVSTWVQTTTL